MTARIRAALCAALLSIAAPAHAGLDSLAGHWEGAYARLGAVQIVALDLTVSGDSLVGTWDVPELGIDAEPIPEIRGSLSGFTVRLTYGAFAMHVAPQRDELTGVNERWKPPVTLHLKRAPLPARPYYFRRGVSFTNGDVRLAGTLTMPLPGLVPHAAVVVIAGSGDQSRQSRPYQGWGEFFARRGIAALTYDKRGTGASEGDFTRATFEELAGDVRAATRLLRQQSDIDSSRIGLFGISQGGWLGPLAASQNDDVAFIIMNVGPAVTVRDQELHRVQYSMRADETDEADIEAALRYTRRVFDAAYGGKGKSALFALADSVLRSPWADYVQPILADQDLEAWRLIRYDPARVLARTTLPLLALFGENDILVPPAENAERLRGYLERAGNRDFTIRVIPGANHDMETFGTLRGGEWKWPAAHWVWPRKAPEFHEAITAWLRERGFGSDALHESVIPLPPVKRAP